jgi:hypothetical protein
VTEPQPADRRAKTQSVTPPGEAQSLLPPEDRRGGALTTANFPEALEWIVSDNPRGLGSDASTRMLLGWVKDSQNRLSVSDQQREQAVRALSESQTQLGEEREKRVRAEARLEAQTEYAPLEKLSIAGGVGLFGIAIERYEQWAIALPLTVIGIVLVFTSVIVGRRSRK